MQNTLQFQDVDQFELEYEHYSDLKDQLGYETVWSIVSEQQSQ